MPARNMLMMITGPAPPRARVTHDATVSTVDASQPAIHAAIFRSCAPSGIPASASPRTRSITARGRNPSGAP